ncbi:DUF3575 domain-containing protein [Hymenobacter lutimineralis]|uniref:DUF3575 domain-containing protein n=1 Tax=Hymenobacter lutimineralis TaxID=2606448 RepID=A0A5D6V2V5_9BACT|nr:MULTISPECIES: DUF3575 domain-containing protein [Hymenobacter]QIX61020.1 DUF3575 domain-containing protein [Hymenobacter sp. BT18]TYZ09657.1 DUF3575 domain-containing protein [Hymenobacter lutimineralis]
MKKVLLSLAVLLGAASAASAQSNAIKVNLFSPLVKTGSFFYERKVSDTQSAQLGFFFTSYSPGDTKFSGFGLTPEYRFYLSGEALDGFYVGPYLRYQSFSLTNTYEDNTGNKEEDKATLSTFGGGIAVGRQWAFKKRITLDPFLGLGYNAGSLDVESGEEDDFDVNSAFDGFGLRVGLTLGVAF